jgi:hypothetical protein
VHIRKSRLFRVLFLLVFFLSGMTAVPFVVIASGGTTVTTTSLIVPCTITTYGNAWNGELGFGIWNPGTNGVEQSYLLIMKTDGTQEFVRSSSDSLGYLVVKNLAQDTVMFSGEPALSGFASGPMEATHFWNYVANVTTDFPNVTGHHDVEYDPVNNTFLVLQDYIRQINGTQILFAKIVELNATGSAIWSWDTYDHIPLSEADPFNITAVVNGTTVVDFTHSNALDWDYNNSIVYLNLRHTNTFYKINQTDGNLIWACGEYGNFTLLEANGTQTKSLWYHSHATKQLAPDVFTMFDNDFHNETNPNDCHSRMIEVTLNEQNMTAWVSWSWAAPKQYWTPYIGDTVRLPNGDRLGTFGSQTHYFNESQPWDFNDTGAVLIEVDPGGNVVRTFTFPTGWGIYRAEPLKYPSSYVPSPTPTPFPTLSPTPAPTLSPTPTPTPKPSPTPTPIPTSTTPFPSPPSPTEKSTVLSSPTPTQTSSSPIPVTSSPIPEIDSWALGAFIILATTAILVVSKRKQNSLR